MDKKKIKILIIVSISVILLLAIGLVAMLYFTTDLFKTNQQTFWKYISNNAQLVNLITSENTQTQEEWKKANSYTSEGNLTISVQKGEEEAQEIHLATSSKEDKTTGRSYADTILKKGEEDLFKVSYIHSDDIYALQATELYEPYLGIRNSNLKEFAKNMGLSEEQIAQIPDSISLEALSNSSNITEQENKYLIDTYSNIIINSIPKEKYTKTEKTNLTIQTTQYEATGYGLTLNEEDLRQIVINVLTKAKDDATTLTILNKIVEQEDVNLQETLQKLLSEIQKEEIEPTTQKEELESTTQLTKIQKEELEPTTLSLLVYQSKGKTIQTQIKINEEIYFRIDIEKNEPQHQKAIITVEPQSKEDGQMESQSQGEGQNVQIILDKQTANVGTGYNTKIIMNLGDKTREVIMNTALEKVADNILQNTSTIIIKDEDTTIDVSYNKTMETATQDLEIPKLDKSNTTVINDYSKQQLEPFFQALGDKTLQVMNIKLNQLNLKMNDESQMLDYLEAVVSSAIVITNANGVEPILGTIGIMGVESVRNVIESTTSVFNKASDSTEATKIAKIKEKMDLIQLRIQMESVTNTQTNTAFTEKSNLLAIAQEEFSGYTVIAGNDFNFDATTKKLIGTVLLKGRTGDSYLANFTDNTVQKQTNNNTGNM